MPIDPWFEDLMAERYDAIMTSLGEIRADQREHARQFDEHLLSEHKRFVAIERSLSVLQWAYTAGAAMLSYIGIKIGWK